MSKMIIKSSKLILTSLTDLPLFTFNLKPNF